MSIFLIIFVLVLGVIFAFEVRRFRRSPFVDIYNSIEYGFVAIIGSIAALALYLILRSA